MADRPAREAMMSDAERAALAALPDPVPVFRGFARDGGERGFSWTLDRGQAEWFAGKHLLENSRPGGKPRVAIGNIAKRDVIAYLEERNEAEILALPEHFEIVRVESIDGREAD